MAVRRGEAVTIRRQDLRRIAQVSFMGEWKVVTHTSTPHIRDVQATSQDYRASNSTPQVLFYVLKAVEIIFSIQLQIHSYVDMLPYFSQALAK
jgi:hypothetical protein